MINKKEHQRIMAVIEKRKNRGACPFSYNDIAKEANAYQTNVNKTIRSLEKQGIVKQIKGKGVVGDPYLFEIIR